MKPTTVQYAEPQAFDLIVQGITEGTIHVNSFGRQNGVYIPMVGGKPSFGGSSGLPDRSDHCPSDSWGETVGIRQTVGGDTPMTQERSVQLGLCVDKYSGVLTPANDSAREFMTLTARR
jgi:hypothetical protein